MKTGRLDAFGRANPDNDPLAPWASRFVMWTMRGSVWHVVHTASVVGNGIVAVLACRRGEGFARLDVDNYYHRRTHVGGKFCRACLAKLRVAGESGSLR